MQSTKKILALAALAGTLTAAQAGVIGQRSKESSSGSTSSVEIQLQPILASALAAAQVPEIEALQPCNAGWPYSPIFDSADAVAWVGEQARAACVVNAAETQLANAITRKTWPDAKAVQAAATALASRLDYQRFRAACPAPNPANVSPITSGEGVKARIDQGELHLALTCDAAGVSITRGGAQLFGQSTIDGRAYSVRLERGHKSSSSVSGAFLN